MATVPRLGAECESPFHPPFPESRDKLIETDKPLYLISAGTCCWAIISSVLLRPNLGRSESPFSLMLQRFQLHFVYLRPLHGADGFRCKLLSTMDHPPSSSSRLRTMAVWFFSPQDLRHGAACVRLPSRIRLRCGADDSGVENAPTCMMLSMVCCMRANRPSP